jgi:predicted MPP superfamily phosphohydrolase
LCIAAFVVIPLAFAREWISFGWTPFETADGTQAYAWLCAVIGAASLVVKPIIERMRYDGRALASWTVDVRDVVKSVGSRPLAGPVAKALDWIPGNETLALSIDRKRLVIPRLPAELTGLTIAHISDLHMTGRIGREYYTYAARAVNDLRPDVIAITGDIVEDERCWPWIEESVGQLCAPLGVFFILGNHDEFIDAGRTRDLLIDFGLTCLSGRWLRAEWNGAPVALVGNELPWMPAAPLGDVHPRSDGDREFRLALCHTPDQFSWCLRAGADLALAGHTHGGQVQLPLLGVIGSPSLHGTRYACGVFRRESTVLHVTRGLGGQTPWRWRCMPEIALLELTSEPGAAS